jgi:eukaryotic-like serine/threonine-protein kinase
VAGLAGAAAVGLGVAGWELGRPGPSHQRPPSGRRTSASGGRATPRQTAKPKRAAPSPGTQIWVSALPATLFAQPDYTALAVAGGIAYLTDSTSNLNALRLTDGKLLWRAVVPNGGQGPGQAVGSASPTDPVVTGGVVYVAGYYNDVMALRASDGTRLWRKAVGNGIFSAPAVADGHVYLISWDNLLRALNAADGSTVWGIPVPGGQTSDPAAAGGAVYVVDNNQTLHALRAASGSSLWTAGVPGGPASEPLPVGGVVYIPGKDRKLHVLDAAGGSARWAAGFHGEPATIPVQAGGIVYMASTDTLYALNAGSGAVLWHVGLTGGAPVETNTEGLKAMAPALADGVIYLAGADSNLHALSAANGTTLWSSPFARGQGAASSPVASGGMVYIAGYDDNVYAFAT